LEIPLLKKQPVRYQKETPELFSAFPEPVILLNAQGKPVGRVETISQARYAVLAAKPQEYLVRVPADEKVLKEVLEAYEGHLWEEGEGYREIFRMLCAMSRRRSSSFGGS
jgi:hypothetical protein